MMERERRLRKTLITRGLGCSELWQEILKHECEVVFIIIQLCMAILCLFVLYNHCKCLIMKFLFTKSIRMLFASLMHSHSSHSTLLISY